MEAQRVAELQRQAALQAVAKESLKPEKEPVAPVASVKPVVAPVAPVAPVASAKPVVAPVSPVAPLPSETPAAPATPAMATKTSETTPKPTLANKKTKKLAEPAKKLPEAAPETPAAPLRWKPVPTRAVQSLAEIQQEQVAPGPA